MSAEDIETRNMWMNAFKNSIIPIEDPNELKVGDVLYSYSYKYNSSVLKIISISKSFVTMVSLKKEQEPICCCVGSVVGEYYNIYVYDTEKMMNDLDWKGKTITVRKSKKNIYEEGWYKYLNMNEVIKIRSSDELA